MVARLLQLNFNAGELDPDMHERVDLETYNNGAAHLENLICAPHGGLKARNGFCIMNRARLRPADITAAISYAYPNGGDLVDPGGLSTATAMAADSDYVVTEITFDAAVRLSHVDVQGYFIDDGSSGAGNDEGTGGGGTGGGDQPTDPLPPGGGGGGGDGDLDTNDVFLEVKR